MSADEKARQYPDRYIGDDDYIGDQGYRMIISQEDQILAHLYVEDKKGNEDNDFFFADAEKNAVLFANSYAYEQTLKHIQEIVNFENRELLNPHPQKELFDKIDDLIEEALGR